jgi:gliding motility-associated-like protein
MRNLFLIPLFLTFSFSFLNSQVLLWDDDFNSTALDWNITLQPGTNDANANIWKINDEEGGVAPPGCGVAGNGDNTLHVGCQGATCIGTGAIYYSGDAGGFGLPGATDIRAAYLNPISTVSETNLEFVFDWIGVGQAGQDFTEIEYSIDGGATWVAFWTQTPGATCGTGQGQWAEETVNLPVATENQADLRFAFHWVNDNDANGTDPSFAVNNLRLFASGTPPPTGPTANFTASSTNICEGDCIDLSDNSTGTNISNWDWVLNGATPVSSSDQNPTNVCYSTAGTYDITLTVTDDNGTDDVTQSITVSSCVNPPVADFSIDTAVICKGNCISFTDESTGDPTAWNWTFDGADPTVSTDQNPSQVCFDSIGTFDVTLTVTNANGTDQTTTSITVLDLPIVEGFGDTIIDIGGAAELSALYSGFGDFFWEPAEHLDCDTCLQVIATPYLTTTFYPTLVGPNGCPGRDTVLVIVNFEEIVEVPSAFSPNNDGLNDRLFVKGIGIVNIDFKIFNRYGQMVYSSTDLEEGWDGTFNGEELNQGVFVYTLEYDLVNGQIGEKSGNVTLVK